MVDIMISNLEKLSPIFFHEKNVRSRLNNKKILKKYLVSLFKNETLLPTRVDIIFCNDEYILYLNRLFLKHDFYTDTLTFISLKLANHVSGEIYISVNRIKENAKQFIVSYQEELVRVIIHGCLHLCGYNDTPLREENKMKNKQELYLKKWFHVKPG